MVVNQPLSPYGSFEQGDKALRVLNAKVISAQGAQQYLERGMPGVTVIVSIEW